MSLTTTIDETRDMLHAYNNCLKRIHEIYRNRAVMTKEEWYELFETFESELPKIEV